MLPEITRDAPLAQTFVVQYDRCSGVEIKFATYQRYNSSHLSIAIRDEAGGIVASQSIASASLADGAYFRIEWPVQARSAGRRFVVGLSSGDGVAGHSVSAWADPDARTDSVLTSGTVAQAGAIRCRFIYAIGIGDLGVRAWIVLALAPIASAGLLWWAARSSPLGSGWTILLLLVGTGVAAAKELIATYGHNFDLESYRIVADLVHEGRNVYSGTPRYNYGPPWFCVLGALSAIDRFAAMGFPESFHVIIAAFLALVDAGIAAFLARTVCARTAVVFLVSPVSLLISGFHSQFDNCAVLLGLLSFHCLLTAAGAPRRTWLSGLLLGVSLSVKHDFIFFPLWVALCDRFGSRRRRIEYGAIAYGVFFASFLPWLIDPVSREGVVGHVFRYKGAFGGGLLSHVVDQIIPEGAFDRAFSLLPLVFHGIKGLWLVLMIALGYLAGRLDPTRSIFLYLIALVATTPSMADQYLAIPMAACAVFAAFPAAWAYIAVATIVLVTSPSDIGMLAPVDDIGGDIFGHGWAWHHAQFWLCVLLVSWWWKAIRRDSVKDPATPPPVAA